VDELENAPSSACPTAAPRAASSCDPNQLTDAELEHLSRRYMQEMVNFVGPHVDVPAPDVGTNEKIMGWMMDTYSNHVGHVESAVVTGKPIALGGSQGRREATGAGVAYLVKRYLEDLKIPLSKATVAIQGFGNVGSETALALQRTARRSSPSPTTPAASTTPRASTSRRPSPTSATRRPCGISTAANPSPTRTCSS
jgi:hypothetical protein